MHQLTEQQKKLIEQGYSLACKLSKSVKTPNYLHKDDRLSAALNGLIEAAIHYREGKKRFDQYAAFVIRREIKTEAWFNRNIRLPYYMRTRIAKYIKGNYIPKEGKNLDCINAAQKILTKQTENNFVNVPAKHEIDVIELQEMIGGFYD